MSIYQRSSCTPETQPNSAKRRRHVEFLVFNSIHWKKIRLLQWQLPLVISGLSEVNCNQSLAMNNKSLHVFLLQPKYQNVKNPSCLLGTVFQLGMFSNILTICLLAFQFSGVSVYSMKYYISGTRKDIISITKVSSAPF